MRFLLVSVASAVSSQLLGMAMRLWLQPEQLRWAQCSIDGKPRRFSMQLQNAAAMLLRHQV